MELKDIYIYTIEPIAKARGLEKKDKFIGITLDEYKKEVEFYFITLDVNEALKEIEKEYKFVNIIWIPESLRRY